MKLQILLIIITFIVAIVGTIYEKKNKTTKVFLLIALFMSAIVSVFIAINDESNSSESKRKTDKMVSSTILNKEEWMRLNDVIGKELSNHFAHSTVTYTKTDLGITYDIWGALRIGFIYFSNNELVKLSLIENEVNLKSTIWDMISYQTQGKEISENWNNLVINILDIAGSYYNTRGVNTVNHDLNSAKKYICITPVNKEFQINKDSQTVVFSESDLKSILNNNRIVFGKIIADKCEKLLIPD